MSAALRGRRLRRRRTRPWIAASPSAPRDCDAGRGRPALFSGVIASEAWRSSVAGQCLPRLRGRRLRRRRRRLLIAASPSAPREDAAGRGRPALFSGVIASEAWRSSVAGQCLPRRRGRRLRRRRTRPWIATSPSAPRDCDAGRGRPALFSGVIASEAWRSSVAGQCLPRLRGRRLRRRRTRPWIAASPSAPRDCDAGRGRPALSSGVIASEAWRSSVAGQCLPRLRGRRLRRRRTRPWIAASPSAPREDAASGRTSR
ncbi:hypothetical protein DFR50_12211 [Roseiarcus fermentans]|uniref:Uncharacterized protein n=1 Tax=Roseiarcus fermentans TaxID=1473586 RepID=A0A366F3K1_9HYPH|nr:hypothetical protein DFR50_12211 [Roseiarcus fermentans]